MDSVYYNSDDPEFKVPLSPMISINTINCDSFTFSYLVNILALRISDNTNAMITNFANVIHGVTNFGDYVSIFTTDYKDSAYIVNLTLTATFLD